MMDKAHNNASRATPAATIFHKWGSAALLICAAGLSGCMRDTVHGSAEPPASFGKVAGNLIGCADVAGVYAWPPVQGRTRAHSLTMERLRAGGGLDPIKVSLFAESQIWLSGVTEGRALAARTRMASAKLIANGALSDHWTTTLVSRAALFCSGAWIALDGETIVKDSPDRSGRKESFSEGLKMARLADGSLVVGQWVRLAGRRESISVFGTELANFPASDVVNWDWARLARVSDNGNTAPGSAAPRPAK